MTEERIVGFTNYIFRYGGLNQLREIFNGVKPHDFVMIAENERAISVGVVILSDGVPRKSEMERFASILLKAINLKQGAVEYCTHMNFTINEQKPGNRFCNMKYSDYINI